MAYSHDGKLLAAATREQLRVWDSSSGTLVAMHDMPESQRSGDNHFACLAFNPEGNLAVGLWSDRSILSWDLRNDSTRVHPIKGAELGMGFLSIAANGQICCVSMNGSVYLLDEEFGIIQEWQVPTSQQFPGVIDRTAFSADGSLVALIEDQRVIRVYSGNLFRCIKTMQAPDGFVFSGITSSTDNKLLVTYEKSPWDRKPTRALTWDMCQLGGVQTVRLGSY